MEHLATEQALAENKGREQRLEAFGEPLLAPVAENLRQLRELLTAGSLGMRTVGVLIGRAFGEKV